MAAATKVHVGSGVVQLVQHFKMVKQLIITGATLEMVDISLVVPILDASHQLMDRRIAIVGVVSGKSFNSIVK